MGGRPTSLFNFDTWECPGCQYLIANITMQSARYDFACPECKKPFAEFISLPAKRPKMGVLVNWKGSMNAK